MSNVLVFGPPGIGKSTICRQLRRECVPSIDLEDIARELPPAERMLVYDQLILESDHIVFGAADLPPHGRYGDDVISVVLWLPEEEYAERRYIRDLKQPDKAKQPAQLMAEWASIPGAVYITADEEAPRKICKLLEGRSVRG